MSDPGPTRSQSDLAEMLEMLLDKGVVINADIAVTVGETELLGVKLRAAIASFETAAEYGLEFPEGTDMHRVEEASGREPLDAEDEPVSVSSPSDPEDPSSELEGDAEAERDADEDDEGDDSGSDGEADDKVEAEAESGGGG